jgi:hypothetical protein
MADTPVPPLEEVLAQIDADIEDDNSPEQKELEEALAQLDQDIADGGDDDDD